MFGGRLSSAPFPTQVCPWMGGCEVWAVAEGQALTGSGSPDLCGHSGPSPCHQLIVTVKFRSCFPNLLCPWACHPRTLMTFCVPAGKHGVIFTLSTPSFVTDPATCMALTLHFLHQLPLVLSLSLFLPEDQGFMNLASTPTLSYPPPSPHAMHHLVTPDILLSQAKSCHFLVTLLLFSHNGNILEHFSHIGRRVRSDASCTSACSARAMSLSIRLSLTRTES